MARDQAVTGPRAESAVTGAVVKALRWVAGLEWLAVAAVAPLLVFPTVRPRWTAGVLIALVVVWGLRWLVLREPWPVTPFNGALLLFALMIPVAVWASALPEFTLPKAAGLVLGLATFRAVAFTVRSRRALYLAAAAFCLLGLVIVAVGALAAQWAGKVDVLGALADRVPRLIATLPGLRTAGVSPNQLAGVLALYLPVAVALAGGWPLGRPRRVVRWLLLAGCLGFLMLVAGLLVLTQSRSGWIGGAAGLLALGTLWGLSSQRRWKRLLGAALPLLTVAAVAGGILYVGPQRAGEVVYGAGGDAAVEEVVGSIGIAGRVEIWSRALYAIQDFPFTGCGLGTFRRVVHILYPLFLIGPDSDIAHAHNIFLQTALDLGLPGLVAYLALLMVAFAFCWRQAGRDDDLIHPLALGLAGGLVGLHIYGLTDAVALGSKPGVAFWFALGLVAVLARVSSASSCHRPSRAGPRSERSPDSAAERAS